MSNLNTVVQSANAVLRFRGYATQIAYAPKYGMVDLSVVCAVYDALPDPVLGVIIEQLKQAEEATHLEKAGSWSTCLSKTPSEVFAEIDMTVLSLINEYNEFDMVPNWERDNGAV